jgi:hypothetical protein
MNLVERVKAILVTPKTEWAVIDGEPGDAGYLFTNYVAILAAIPAIGFLVHALLVFSFFGSLLAGVVSYVLYIVGWYVQALVIDALAPTFGGRKDMASALKVAAYASTAAWLAGIFRIIPAIALLSLLGFYSLYLLYLGLPVLMKAPPERSLVYTIVVVVVMAVVFVIVSMLLLALSFRPF